METKLFSRNKQDLLGEGWLWEANKALKGGQKVKGGGQR